MYDHILWTPTKLTKHRLHVKEKDKVFTFELKIVNRRLCVICLKKSFFNTSIFVYTQIEDRKDEDKNNFYDTLS